MFPRVLMVAGAILVGAGGPARAAPLEPPGADAFFVAPDRPAVLRWNAAGKLETTPSFTIRDYWGREAARGTCALSAGGPQCEVTLPQGFYEIELSPDAGRYGVVSLPAFEGKPDPFFAVDAAMSWLVRGDAAREGLVKALRRSGIGMSRERLTWGAVHPGADQWDWETPSRFGRLRNAYREHGVEVLEMFHDSPAWMGLVGKYPDDLVAASRSWRAIAQHWRPAWGAIDVWNEPDIFFGANLPADQYAPLVKTVAWAFGEEKTGVPILGGVVAHHNRRFLDCAARNGLLDCCDAVSFHTYARAADMEGLVGKYHEWLRAFGRESTPLCLTECGRPWKRGPDRPPADQDAESALDITMKAVEARACGVARYFAFVYPFYEENQNNFGMMGREATPLRSMAAYARLALLLAGRDYLGDLQCDRGASVLRARVFAASDEKEAVAVLYVGKPDPAAVVKPGLPVLRAEGIDGRALKADDDGAVPAPDGLVYVWLARDALGPRLKTDAPAMQLLSAARKPAPQRPAPSPVVLRFQYDKGVLEAKTEGYRVVGETPEKLRLTVRAMNLSDRAREVTLKMTHSFREAPLFLDGGERRVTVPAGGRADASWDVDVRPALAAGNLVVEVTATSPAAGTIQPLAFDLIGK